MAPVQISQKKTRNGIPTTRAQATSTLWFLCLSIQLLQVLVTLLILHRFWVISFSEPLFLIQLLLQPLFSTQLLQWQPLQVQIILNISLTGSCSTKDGQEQTRPPSHDGQRHAAEAGYHAPSSQGEAPNEESS